MSRDINNSVCGFRVRAELVLHPVYPSVGEMLQNKLCMNDSAFGALNNTSEKQVKRGAVI